MVNCVGIQSCGDNVTEGTELCDDGVNDGDPGQCAPGALTIQTCGDAWSTGQRGLRRRLQRRAGGRVRTGMSERSVLRRRGHRGHRAVRRRDQRRHGPARLPAGLLWRQRLAATACLEAPEICDDGVNDGGEGECLPAASGSRACGDSRRPRAPSSATTAPTTATPASVAPGCLTIQTCGDAVVEGKEVCDDGTNDGGEGECLLDLPQAPELRRRPATEGTEQCDDGQNDGVGPLGCLPGCLSPATRAVTACGRGHRARATTASTTVTRASACPVAASSSSAATTSAEGTELCDDGINDGDPGQCAPGCLTIETCGDAWSRAKRSATTASTTVSKGECAPGCVTASKPAAMR